MVTEEGRLLDPCRSSNPPVSGSNMVVIQPGRPDDIRAGIGFVRRWVSLSITGRHRQPGGDDGQGLRVSSRVIRGPPHWGNGGFQFLPGRVLRAARTYDGAQRPSVHLALPCGTIASSRTDRSSTTEANDLTTPIQRGVPLLLGVYARLISAYERGAGSASRPKRRPAALRRGCLISNGLDH